MQPPYNVIGEDRQSALECWGLRLRLAAAAVGLSVCVLGIGLSLTVFSRLVPWIDDPGELHPRLDAWERVIAGQIEAKSSGSPAPNELALDLPADDNSKDSAPRHIGIQLPFRWARSLAAGLLVLAFGGMGIIAVARISAGVQMVMLVGPVRRTIRRIIAQFPALRGLAESAGKTPE